MPREKKEKVAKDRNAPVTREYTVNLRRQLHNIQFKRRAPKAIKILRRFAKKEMHTKDVRLDSKLNHFVWSTGIKNVPFRVRVRLSKRRNENEDAKEKMYTLVTWVPCTEFHFTQTKNIREKH
ncbi:60S ribosomal protein L31 [Pelomyxa schiedti]|nr:60S ribosomal protein L31 [Pelomyxa schiedti]